MNDPLRKYNTSADDIRAAAARIAPFVRRTSLERSETLSRELGTNVFVKQELFQKTGSFKVRGAFNKMLLMTPEQRACGVVAVSGGNHAQAVAYAASASGVDAVIVMPANTAQVSLDATRAYGATIELRPTIADAFARMAELEAAGRVSIHPFEDPLVMAGQGTVGLEIVEDLPDLTDVFVSIGGGGLAGAVAIAAKAHNSTIRMWGVETEGADAMAQALEAGSPVTMPAITSIAKTLGAPFVTDPTLDIARDLFESVTVVADREAVAAMITIAERLKLMAEPAAACTLAAARRMKEKFSPTDNIVLILCGGNTGVRDLCGYLSIDGLSEIV